MDFTEKDLEFIDSMRMRGFAIVAFAPSELGRAEGQDLEDYLAEKGNEFIAIHNPE